MGIKGLWEVRSHTLRSLCRPLSRKQVIEPAAVEVHLLALALANRYQGVLPHKPYIIWVDAR
jgi:hypothetical protein